MIGRPDTGVAFSASQGVSQLAPRRVSDDVRRELTPVQGVGVLPVEGCNAHLDLRNQLRIDEFGYVLNALKATRGMQERDEGVRLAAAILGVQTEDG